LQKQKTAYHWDKRSKKYVKLNNGDRVTASGKVKTESGSRIKPGSGGLYKKWKERSHMHISAHGQGDDNHAEGSEGAAGNQARGNGRDFHRHKKQRPIPNANVRDELRGVEQIRKQRQQKATKHILGSSKKRTNGKGIKGGKGFKGGKGGNNGKKTFKSKGKRK